MSTASAHDPHPDDGPSGDGAGRDAETRRRRWLLGAVAGTATLAGAGLAWWQARPGTRADAMPGEFWDTTLPTAAGAPLPMRSLAGKPLLLNFWATWCPPCIEEMPLLDSFYTQNSQNGWQVLGIAIDKADAVQRFLDRTPVRYPIALADVAGVGLSRALGNQAGGLPFTVIVNRAGAIVQRKMGRATLQDLQQWRGAQ